jgi:hypothetical protein
MITSKPKHKIKRMLPDELPQPDELAFENVPLVLAAWQEHTQCARFDR